VVILKATLFNARSQEPVPADVVRNPFVKLGSQITLDTPSTTTVQLFWFPALGAIGPSFLRVEMFDGSGRMLAVTDSTVIRNDRTALPQA
jgi:hypothetical protein